jgi:hypothetical protein
VGSILKVILQLVMFRFNSKVSLFLMVIIPLSARVMAQCPEKIIVGEGSLNDTDQKEILVYDSFDSGINISNFEINIFNELTGNYVVVESSNFPRIGINNDIDINKTGHRIRITNVPGDLNLLRCVIIFVGGDCPIKKITITDR